MRAARGGLAAIALVAASVFLFSRSGVAWAGAGSRALFSSAATAQEEFDLVEARLALESLDPAGSRAQSPLSVSAVAVAPTSPAPTIYVGTWGSGVFRSLDRGASWSPVDGEASQVTSIAVFPQDATSIVAGTADRGVLRASASGGYVYLASGLPSPEVRTVAVGPTTPIVLYAGTPFGLYRSIDDGVTWTVMGLAGDAIDSIYVDGAGQVVYAGTERRGVQRSRDGGLTWSGLGNVRLPVEGLVFSDDRKVLYVSTDGGGVARIGFFKELSKDGGATMDTDPPAASGPFGGTVIDLELDPITPTTLYAATNVGLFKSIDNGDSWQVTGLDSRPVFSVAVDPVNSNAVYAGTAGDGVLRSGDGGLTWTAAGDGPIQGKVLYDLAVDPSNSQTIYAAGRAAHIDGTTSGDWGGGVFKSLDGGTTWGQMNEGLPEGWVYALAVDPLQPSTLYAGTHSMGVFKSLDGGMTWAPKNDGLVTTNHPSPDNLRIRSIAIDPRNPQNLTIGVWGGSGVFESDSAAETWRLAGRGGLRARVRSVAYNPVTPGVVYAGMAEGGARFTQHLPDDDRWHPFPDQPGGGWNDFSIVSAIAVHPADGRTVFLGVYGAGVLRTTDGGQTWQAVNEGLAASSVTALVSLPTHPATLYAATRGSGIFESTDGGAHWSPHAWAGPLDWAVDLAIDPSDPQTLYVATEANGLLPLDLRSGAVLTTPQAPTDTPGLVPPATATSLP